MVDSKALVRPISDRIARVRKHFKDAEYHSMYCCSERTRILTESYRKNEADYPLLKRAKFFRDLCEQMTVLVEDGVLPRPLKQSELDGLRVSLNRALPSR